MSSAGLPQYGSPAEVAARLGYSTKTIRRMYRDGRLPAYRLGPRRVLIPMAEVDALVRRSPVAVPASATAVDASGEAIPFATPELQMRKRRALAALADDDGPDDPEQVERAGSIGDGLGIGGAS